MIPVRDLKLRKGMTVRELVEQFETSGGFVAKKLATACRILAEMIRDDDCVRFLSLTANIMATGARGAIVELLRRKLFDVVVTTCGSLDHDVARSWGDYYHGSFLVDDAELRKRDLSRLGNVIVPSETYGKVVEEKMKELFAVLKARNVGEMSPSEVALLLGELIGEKSPRKEESFLYWCWKNEIPVIVPGFVDGAVGWHFWSLARLEGVKLNPLKDENKLSDIVLTARKTGALILGGGISKHHVIWWNQFRDGLDYAIYVTTAVEWDGSLSGARPREAVSWGKIKEDAKTAIVEGDVTLVLPLMVAYVIEEL